MPLRLVTVAVNPRFQQTLIFHFNRLSLSRKRDEVHGAIADNGDSEYCTIYCNNGDTERLQ